MRWSDGGYKYTVGGKVVAKFQPSEMKSVNKNTYVVGKPFHYKIMNILKPLAIKKWSIISLDIHRIIEFLENGSDEDEEYRPHTTQTTKRLTQN
ncbi:MAG: hypothetical protein IIC67_11650 [Thaumarchaeota archaeon]|nr:hypothetical protein [Nitrososphaerota archaeon]